MFDITGSAFNWFAGVLVNVCKRTCCDLELMLSADSFMEAMDCVAARRSFGSMRWNRSGDSSGLVAAEPSVAFTRKLSEWIGYFDYSVSSTWFLGWIGLWGEDFVTRHVCNEWSNIIWMQLTLAAAVNFATQLWAPAMVHATLTCAFGHFFGAFALNREHNAPWGYRLLSAHLDQLLYGIRYLPRRNQTKVAIFNRFLWKWHRIKFSAKKNQLWYSQMIFFS